MLLVEQKSAGRDLRKAYEQAGEYFDALPERERPRFLLVSDFQAFELYDLDEWETVAFPLADLPAHVESFGFILGVQRRTFRDQDPANIEAAELVGRLHDALADAGHQPENFTDSRLRTRIWPTQRLLRKRSCIRCVERGPGARRTVKYACAPGLAFALRNQPSPRPRFANR